MNVCFLFSRHFSHFFGVVRVSFSSQKFCFSVTLFVFFEQNSRLVKRFWRVFRNPDGFDDFQNVVFFLSILFLELVRSEKLLSLLNHLPIRKVGKDPESAF
jgi:hypothetical protein